MTTRLIGFGVALILAVVVGVSAQGGPPQPSAEQKRLGYFVGKWTSDAEVKPSPLGPGGKMTSSDSCEWFPGGFHVVCRSSGKGPMGAVNGLGILGYNADMKAYTYYGIDNSGMGDLATGTLQGKVWNWTGESKVGGKVMKSRYIITETSPTSYTFKWEASTDGGPWNVIMEGKVTKATT